MHADALRPKVRPAVILPSLMSYALLARASLRQFLPVQVRYLLTFLDGEQLQLHHNVSCEELIIIASFPKMKFDVLNISSPRQVL
jgi:hypothetical protein